MSKHVINTGILAHEQKGARTRCRGTKDQLLIDKAITNESKRYRKNLSMAWIDYKKAFDSIPHSWILETMSMYKINNQLQELIRQSMKYWKTMLIHEKKPIGEIPIQSGIFQGDALSPIIFCVALNPLSQILHKSNMGYTMRTGEKLNHLLYMDDLKLYAKTEDQVNSLIHTTRIFSNDIGMEFGISKCARLIIKRGEVKETEGLALDLGTIDDAK